MAGSLFKFGVSSHPYNTEFIIFFPNFFLLNNLRTCLPHTSPVSNLFLTHDFSEIVARYTVNRWPQEAIHLLLVPLLNVIDNHPPGTYVINNMPNLALSLTELMGL